MLAKKELDIKLNSIALKTLSNNREVVNVSSKLAKALEEVSNNLNQKTYYTSTSTQKKKMGKGVRVSGYIKDLQEAFGELPSTAEEKKRKTNAKDKAKMRYQS